MSGRIGIVARAAAPLLAGLAIAVCSPAVRLAQADERLAGAPDTLQRERYLLHCSGCHAADGRGIPGHSPSLRDLGELLEHEGGRTYLGRVPGVAQAPLDDAALAALLNWVLTSFSNAPPHPPYTASEIGRLRSAPLRDPRSMRAALMRSR